MRLTVSFCVWEWPWDFDCKTSRMLQSDNDGHAAPKIYSVTLDQYWKWSTDQKDPYVFWATQIKVNTKKDNRYCINGRWRYNNGFNSNKLKLYLLQNCLHRLISNWHLYANRLKIEKRNCSTLFRLTMLASIATIWSNSYKH